MTPPAAKSPPNPLLEIGLTIILPSLALDHLSKADRLGPFWALVVSLLPPLAFGIWCWWKKAGLNLFSVLGIVTILLSGGIGLFRLDAFWVALKESALPIIIGLAFPLSHRWGRPLINAMIMQPHLLNLKQLQNRMNGSAQIQAGVEAATLRASWGLGLGMVGSSVANFFLALWLLEGKAPGSEAFVKGLGTLTWAGTLVIGVPLMAIMMVVFFWFIRQLQLITGLEREDLMNPGQTVRKQIVQE